MTLKLVTEWTMGLSRRFLNLIVDNRIPGTKSLSCIDLMRLKLFNTTPPNGNLLKNGWATEANFKMGKISLPSPSFNMRVSDSELKDQRMHCFPAADRRVFCLDQSGRGLLLEADTSRLVMLPRLHKPKLEPISLYIPCADDLDGLDGGGSLFVMDRITKPQEVEAAACQFEALVFRIPEDYYFSKSWDCELLPPPPPYILDETRRPSCLEISSYAVLKGGSQICISVRGVGTYCLDTASYKWNEVGKWTLPFQGKVEYVPELKLWFGFSAKDRHLAAADLSTMDMDSQPQLLDSWNELVDLPTQGWQQIQDPQLVHMGSRRFCIARFLHTARSSVNCGLGDESSHQNLTVLTGVEVSISRGFDLKVKLGMVRHKSRCHKSSCGEDTITAVL